MDKKQICRIITPLLKGLSPKELKVELIGSEIKLEIVSEDFKGLGIITRIKMVSNAVSLAFSSELIDFNLRIIPVTSKEKYNGEIETSHIEKKEGMISGQAAASNSNSQLSL